MRENIVEGWVLFFFFNMNLRSRRSVVKIEFILCLKGKVVVLKGKVEVGIGKTAAVSGPLSSST